MVLGTFYVDRKKQLMETPSIMDGKLLEMMYLGCGQNLVVIGVFWRGFVSIRIKTS